MTGLRITGLHREAEHGYWVARLHLDGEALGVDRKYGTWQTGPLEARRELTRAATRALQERVRKLERAEKRREEIAA